MINKKSLKEDLDEMQIQTRNKIGNQLLVQSDFAINAFELFLKLTKISERWLSHHIQHGIRSMFGCNF